MNILQTSDPAQDDTLNILMIGSSFCYYYVDELYGMLAADGIKANVCNVYYSGCPLEKHWQWWKSGEANYDYYETSETGRWETKDVNLQYCLEQKNWDFISLQESSGKIATKGGDAHLDATRTYWRDLLDYLMEQFPLSRIGWHQTWSNQVEYGKEGSPITPPEQEYQQTQQETFAKGICEYYKGKVERIPSGRAWQNARTKYNYDYMTCRLSQANGQGDGYHDGDVGGGQYLNACVWYEIITGKNCLSNPFRPAYKAGSAVLSAEVKDKLNITLDGSNYLLSEDVILLLQNAAHEAVASTGLAVTE